MATFRGRTKRAKLEVRGEHGIVNVAERYRHCLQIYSKPPTEELSLEEFEQFAVERLKVLREIENFGIRFKRDSDEYNKRMKDLLKGFLPADFLEGSEKRLLHESGDYSDTKRKGKEEERLQNRRKDHISHFILRLAFSRTEDLRRWFLNQEIELFRYRFQQEPSDEVDRFLQMNNLHYQTISEEEKRENCEQLRDSGFDLSNEKVMNTDYYKVYFTEAIDLIKGRKVYLAKGFAYIPRGELVSIIMNEYRSQLSKALAITSRQLPYLQENERLLPMLKNLSTAYIGDSYTTRNPTNGDKVTLDQLDSLAKISYPLCMRQLHETLRQQHHLRHFARLQFGLFLKGIGLTLEEALIFWRTEFTKVMDVDKFDKQYAYNIRHSFGKEGKRASYTPYSCMKVITGNQPGPGDSHGCPFKHSDPEILAKKLQMYKVPKDGIDEIISLVKGQHYQVACVKYFEISHKVSEGSHVSINHPNGYFDESVKVLKNIKTGEKNEIQTRATPSYTVQREWTANDQNKPIATQGKPEPTTVDDDADLLNDDFDMEGLDEM